jgi:hypothetical protein
MSLRTTLMLLSVSLAMSGMGNAQGMRFDSPNRRPQPRKRTEGGPDNLIGLTERLEQGNAERRQRFPQWKEWEVDGHKVVAATQKKAFQHFNKAKLG